jgi:carbon-monoxide dehydrogenase medium subunit
LIPSQFEYHAPSTLREATDLLSRYGSEAKVLAGGMSLIPVMKLRLATPHHVIDISRISELEYARLENGRLKIGALCRHSYLEKSKVIIASIPLLSETAKWIGDPQVRNMGTIGGSLVHSDPSGDWGAPILALRGEIRMRSSLSERSVSIDDFLVDTFTSALRTEEILTEIVIPVPSLRSGGTYMKVERRAGDFATVGIAVQLTIDKNSVCTYVGIGLTALGPKSLRARRSEEALLGRKISESAIQEAAEAAAEDSSPLDDPLRGSVEYKRELARVYTRRALKKAIDIATK